MASQTGQQIIIIQILLDISQIKRNQTMKFGQSIDYNKRNILLQKSYTKCGGEASPRPFNKKSYMEKYLNQPPETLYSFCYYMSQLLTTKIY